MQQRTRGRPPNLSARVCKTYVAQYPDPIVMAPGDGLQLGKRDPEYPGWIWATSARTDKSGWVPEDYVEIAGAQGSARRAFTARELAVKEGETVTVVEELLGWAWVKTPDDREGWVPMSHLAQRGDAEMKMEKINLESKLAQFEDHWRPRTVAQMNDYDVMLVKVRGEFVWHKHDETDDFFLVIAGNLEIRLRDRTVRLGPGELFVVPRGVEHQPYAAGEVSLLLIEPRGTPNTGDPKTAAPRQEL